jgi:hypothetical protein
MSSPREGYTYIAPLREVDDFEAGWGDSQHSFNRLFPAIACADSTPEQHVSIMTHLIEVVKGQEFSRYTAAELLGRAAVLAAERDWAWEQEILGELKLGDIVRVHPFRVFSSEGFEPPPMIVAHLHPNRSVVEAKAIIDYETENERTSSAGTIEVKNFRSHLGHADLERMVNMYRNSLPTQLSSVKLDEIVYDFRKRWEEKLTEEGRA